jgi:glycerol-3-phosphate dehydrogenase
MNSYDIIIIGAGVAGASAARFLSRYDLKILWIEKESDICMGASCANSAIIHAGYDATSGTLKSSMNILGNRIWPVLAEQLDIPYMGCGSYVIAQNSAEFSQIKSLYDEGVTNGISGLEILTGKQVCDREPLLAKNVCGALWAPTAGVIDPFDAVLGMAENAVANGVELMLETAFESFIIENEKIKGITTNKGEFGCKWVVNCAGLYSDEVMHKAGVHLEFEIKPRRGEYIIFDPARIKLDKVFFPAPSEKGKGILVTTTVHGNVMAGPNSWFVNSKENSEITSEGVKEIFENAKQMIPSLDFSAVIAEYAGLRATGNSGGKDFIIEIADEVEGLINLAGIESPGFASAPAIAQRVVELLGSRETLIEKKDWKPQRKRKPSFRTLSHNQRQELIAQKPAYGRIVCRCENVTEGEIVDVIHSIVPAANYDAIKRRTWLGTGRCQGGFDYSRTIEILSRELGVPVAAVSKKGSGSEFVYRMTKDSKGLL